MAQGSWSDDNYSEADRRKFRVSRSWRGSADKQSFIAVAQQPAFVGGGEKATAGTRGVTHVTSFGQESFSRGWNPRGERRQASFFFSRGGRVLPGKAAGWWERQVVAPRGDRHGVGGRRLARQAQDGDAVARLDPGPV